MSHLKEKDATHFLIDREGLWDCYEIRCSEIVKYRRDGQDPEKDMKNQSCYFCSTTCIFFESEIGENNHYYAKYRKAGNVKHSQSNQSRCVCKFWVP